MTVSAKTIEKGQEIPSVKKDITLDMFRLYCWWPKRNMHTDEEIAKESGLPSPIGEGLMTVQYMTELLTNFWGPGWLKGGKINASFIKYVQAGDTITVRGLIQDKIVEGTTTTFNIDVWCENQRGEKVSVGTASAVIS